jgi:hypothetical protein
MVDGIGEGDTLNTTGTQDAESVRPTVALVSNDLHVWLDCSCGWQVDLGDTPSPWDATQKAEMHLFRKHPQT